MIYKLGEYFNTVNIIQVLIVMPEEEGTLVHWGLDLVRQERHKSHFELLDQFEEFGVSQPMLVQLGYTPSQTAKSMFATINKKYRKVASPG